MTEDFIALRPLALSGPADRVPAARHLAGGVFSFSAVEAIRRGPDGHFERASIALEHLADWARAQNCTREVGRVLNRLSAPRPPFAGLPMAEGRR